MADLAEDFKIISVRFGKKFLRPQFFTFIFLLLRLSFEFSFGKRRNSHNVKGFGKRGRNEELDRCYEYGIGSVVQRLQTDERAREKEKDNLIGFRKDIETLVLPDHERRLFI